MTKLNSMVGLYMDRITKTSDGLRDASPLGSMPERTFKEISDQGGESYPHNAKDEVW